MPASVGQFVESLLHGGIIHPEDLHHCIGQLEAEGRELTDHALANRLQREGKLTNYQLMALLGGKAEGITFGNYIVLDRLGAGGMGTVYKARHRRMKRVVAIKVLPRSKIHLPEQVAQFQCEVEAVARLSHPNIVTAHDADECSLGHFLVMEYVAGSDLAQVVQTQGPLAPAEAVDYVVQTARALEYAHKEGVVHCDIKPANMLRDSRGTIKVADLGLARFLAVNSTETRSGLHKNTISGTLDFMSPEQGFNPSLIDHRSDIYSLGCSLFYLLTGQVLFSGETVMEKLGARLRPVQRSLRECRPDVPAALDQIYLRMVSTKIEERYQSMAEVIEALEACELPEPDAQAKLAVSRSASSSVVISAPTSWHTGQEITVADLSLLLVEPSRLQARIISGQMQELGIRRLQTAATGEAALGIIQGTKPDIVVSSMHLPDMTGADLVRRMREASDQHAPAFVLISSETDQQYLEPVRQAGTAAILPKPFDLNRLRHTLAAAVDFFSPHALRIHNLNAGALRVLIVDDSRAARRHIRRVLENMGMSAILEAAGASRAIDMLATTPIDLLVTDYNMPDMDGPTLVRYVRADKDHRDMPILMITSETDAACLDEARAAGVSAVCSKVFDPQTVCGILEKILAQAEKSV